MEKLLFIKTFIKNWRQVGSIAPSSKFLVDKMLAPIDFKRSLLIVEFGPGSGPITKKLLHRMNSKSRLLVFEPNKDFCVTIEKINDSRLTIFNESALSIEFRLNGEVPDHIISGIPLAMLPKDEKKKLLCASYKLLARHGRFIQFQYSFESLKDLKNIFQKVSITFTPFNIPPAFVFSCKKL